MHELKRDYPFAKKKVLIFCVFVKLSFLASLLNEDSLNIMYNAYWYSADLIFFYHL